MTKCLDYTLNMSSTVIIIIFFTPNIIFSFFHSHMVRNIRNVQNNSLMVMMYM